MTDLRAEGPLLRADARANRARLIAAAREVFRQRGLEAEMREVADTVDSAPREPEGRIGQQLGHYLIEARIGSGNISIVGTGA